jgi:hypothetical protein
MEILDLKFAGITLWTWCVIIAIVWLAFRYGDRILNFLSIAWGLVIAAVLVLAAIVTVLAVPVLIYDGEWLPLLGLFGFAAFVAMLAALDRMKYRPNSVGWHIYPRRRGPPTSPR